MRRLWPIMQYFGLTNKTGFYFPSMASSGAGSDTYYIRESRYLCGCGSLCMHHTCVLSKSWLCLSGCDLLSLALLFLCFMSTDTFHFESYYFLLHQLILHILSVFVSQSLK